MRWRRRGHGGERAAPRSTSRSRPTSRSTRRSGPPPPTTPTSATPTAQRELQDRPFTISWPTFPPTLRTEGPNANLVQHQHGPPAPLRDSDPDRSRRPRSSSPTWRRTGASRTTTPPARRCSGSTSTRRRAGPTASPVTAADVYYSWWHRVQEDRNDPSSRITYQEGFEEPEIVDRHTIKVRTKTMNWRLFLYFGGMLIFPAKEIAIPGEQYLQELQLAVRHRQRPLPARRGRGHQEGRVGDRSPAARDWWAENEPWARNTYNFGKVRFLVIRDEELEYEQFKKGDLDWFIVRRAQQWVEEAPRGAGDPERLGQDAQDLEQGAAGLLRPRLQPARGALQRSARPSGVRAPVQSRAPDREAVLQPVRADQLDLSRQRLGRRRHQPDDPLRSRAGGRSARRGGVQGARPRRLPGRPRRQALRGDALLRRSRTSSGSGWWCATTTRPPASSSTSS